MLAPLAIAAGLDLYLTLLFIGAAPTIGLWDLPLAGALGDLDSPGVLIMVGVFFILEFAAERFPTAALTWNTFHAVIRPLSGALLALLLLDGQPLPLLLLGALIAGALASAAHGVRTGAAVVRWLASGTAPSLLLVSLAEDVVVLGIVSLALDLPLWASAASLLLVVGSAWAGPSYLRAFGYAIRLALGRVFQTLRQRRWRGSDELPEWVREALENDDVLAPGGALRGSPVGAFGLRGAPKFATGWVVVRGGAPVFLFRRGPLPLRRKTPVRIDLGAFEADAVLDENLFRRVDLALEGASACLLFGVGGPSAESLRAEFQFAEF